jgi:large subunit ribosomal protein L21
VGVFSLYAIIEVAGKQQKISEGDVLYTNNFNAKKSKSVEFKVFAIGSEKGLEVGKPYLERGRVIGEVLKNFCEKKITVLTYKPKKHSKRKLGQKILSKKIKIQSIGTF